MRVIIIIYYYLFYFINFIYASYSFLWGVMLGELEGFKGISFYHIIINNLIVVDLFGIRCE